MGALLMKSLLLLCFVPRSMPFGLAGSEIRANRAPISCFPSETRRYSSSGASGSASIDIAVGKEADKETSDEANPGLEQNTKYIKGLIETLESLLDKWVLSGAMATRRRAYNILQQIERLSSDKDLTLQAERMVKRSGMPMEAPPPIPPTEHIPAVDQQQPQPRRPTNVVNKPMGPMDDDTPVGHAPKGYRTSESYDMNVGSLLNSNGGRKELTTNTTAKTNYSGEDRKEDADERLAWEKSHREKNVFMDNMKEKMPRSALSARMADAASGGNKGGDPFLNGVVEGMSGGLDPFAFAEDKKELQTAMKDSINDNSNSASSSAAASSSSSSASSSSDSKKVFKPTKISTSKKRATADTRPGNSPQDRAARRAAAKFSELIARAGSGDAFLGSVLGVGGLDDVLARIQRRVWVPLAAPPTLLSELGIQPVRGLLLYGSPGCGKTLLARKLGGILSPCRPITIVSGPEILDKFVGSSEKNLRELFDEPPEIYREYKKNYGEPLAKQALHVIVLDEFDAISRRRGGSGGKGDQGDAGVARDSVVNQLLAKMDGYDGPGVPTLLVGLTNKPSLIDPALMRPGRFEVQIEVPKPRTVEQRVSILKVHTESMINSGRMLVKDAPEGTAAWKRVRQNGEEGIPSYDDLLDILAVECDGMSGASLAGVARAAASRALERAVTDFAGHIANSSESTNGNMEEEGNSIDDCLVTQEDFEKAVEDVFESSKGGDYTEPDDTAANRQTDKKDELNMTAVHGELDKEELDSITAKK